MFEFLFQYPASVFARGKLVFLSSWPLWLLGLAIVGGALALAVPAWRNRERAAVGVKGLKLGVLWSLQFGLLALLLLMLWQPALSVSSLKPQQNVVAVLVDDSRSMALQEDGSSRKDQAAKVLTSGLLDQLRKKFQVRLYRFGDKLERVEKLEQLKSDLHATRIGDSLQQVIAESATLPIGAVLLLSDGADNAGGLDLDTMNAIRRRRIPIHTVGFGREKFNKDIELTDAVVAARALADSRLTAQVTFRQTGYNQSKAKISIKEGGKVLAAREVLMKSEGAQQAETLVFSAGGAGLKSLQVAIDVLPGEENQNNNAVVRLLHVEDTKPRILYMEGEPRWEFKFIRRAMEEDKSLQLTTILRTTQNKIYRQGIKDSKEHEEGFPAKVEDLFGYQGVIVGTVEAGYFNPAQQELMRQFVDRRGGGVLFLGGRSSFSDGGWVKAPLAEVMPVTLPDRKGTFHRDPANVELTAAGRDSLICRLVESPEANVDRWKKLPYLADFQELGAPKPGAVVLVDALPTSKGRLPLLITQNYGRGRSAIFATSGSWRWQMLQPLADQTHEMFWQQLLRWLVQGTPGRLVASTPKPVLEDDDRVVLRAEVRDRNYLPLTDGKVSAQILGPEGMSTQVDLQPDPLTPGLYTAEWKAEKPGAYVAEVTAKRAEEDAGRDVLHFRREDGVAEYFHAEQNRELLEKLAQQTGGLYFKASDVSKLPDEITYSEAGITVREAKDLWNMPVVFLALFLLRAGEWVLRRRWGIV